VASQVSLNKDEQAPTDGHAAPSASVPDAGASERASAAISTRLSPRHGVGHVVRRGSVDAASEIIKAVRPHIRRAGSLFSSSVTTDPRSANMTMVLFLQHDTFLDHRGELLAEEVRIARMLAMPIVLMHRVDSCPFSWFFETTPRDLIEGGLYKTVAIDYFPSTESHKAASSNLFLKALGATRKRSRSSPQATVRRLASGMLRRAGGAARNGVEVVVTPTTITHAAPATMQSVESASSDATLRT